MSTASQRGPILLTVGHSIHEPPAFLDLLRGAGVEGVADVRRFPGSRRNPQFSSDELAATLAGPTGRSSHRPASRSRSSASPNDLRGAPHGD